MKKRKVEIVFTQEIFNKAKKHLLPKNELEFSGFLFCGKMENEKLLRLLVREFLPVTHLDYEDQSKTSIEVRKEFCVNVLEKVSQEKLNLIEIHSHPFSQGSVNFSGIDLAGQQESFPYVAKRIPEIYHANCVLGQNCMKGHIWDKKSNSISQIDEVRIIGDSLQRMKIGDNIENEEIPGQNRYSRQIMALGKEGQQKISSVKVGIVGCGGIGWNVALQLTHLGVRDFVLIDKDTIDVTNLNRLIGAERKDVGRHKVIVLKDRLKRINPNASIIAVRKKLGDENSFDELKSVDVLIGCVDNFGTRLLLLNNFAAQYLIPYFDAGTEIRVKKNKIAEVISHYKAVIPGHTSCLECIGLIDKTKAAQDLLPDKERKIQIKRGYITGAEIPAPAVLPLNNVILSLMVWEIVNFLTAFKKFKLFCCYDGVNNEIITKEFKRKTDCFGCGKDTSNFARGDDAPLPSAYTETAKNVPFPEGANYETRA